MNGPGVRFTLIVAAYNHERFLADAVKGIRSQTRPFDRIIFFSDGSKDGTLELARSLLGDDPRVTWLGDPGVNRGLVPRLIEAAALVDDGYIMQHAADDVLQPDACETFAALAGREPFEWAIGATRITDQDLHPGKLIDPTLAGPPDGLFLRLLKADPWPPAQGWCYSAGLLRRVGGYEPGLLAEDYSLGLRFARATTPVLSSRVIQLWRMNAASVGHALAEEMWLEHARVALRYLGTAPAAALVASSSFMAQAAMAALRKGRSLRALRHGAASALLRPDPRRIVRGAAAFLRERFGPTEVG